MMGLESGATESIASPLSDTDSSKIEISEVERVYNIGDFKETLLRLYEKPEGNISYFPAETDQQLSIDQRGIRKAFHLDGKSSPYRLESFSSVLEKYGKIDYEKDFLVGFKALVSDLGSNSRELSRLQEGDLYLVLNRLIGSYVLIKGDLDKDLAYLLTFLPDRYKDYFTPSVWRKIEEVAEREDLPDDEALIMMNMVYDEAMHAKGYDLMDPSIEPISFTAKLDQQGNPVFVIRLTDQQHRTIVEWLSKIDKDTYKDDEGHYGVNIDKLLSECEIVG